ncbi:hypothetical protein ACQ4PT_047680 [Festuca glaucescens]
MALTPWVCLLLLLAIVPACHARPLVEEDFDGSMATQPLRPSVISCSTAGNYNDGGPYHVNLYRLLSDIPMAVDSNGFFSGTFGTAGDEAFGLFMCYAGDTDAECQDCLDHAPDGYVVDKVGLSQTRLKLIRRLTVKASQAAVRIAEGTQPFTDTQWVRAVVQCTRDLPPSECTRCLSYYTDQLPLLFSRTIAAAPSKGLAATCAKGLSSRQPMYGWTASSSSRRWSVSSGRAPSMCCADALEAAVPPDNMPLDRVTLKSERKNSRLLLLAERKSV